MLARLYPLRLVTSHTFLYKKLDEYEADHDKEVLDRVAAQGQLLAQNHCKNPTEENPEEADPLTQAVVTLDSGRKIVFDNIDYNQKVHYMTEQHQNVDHHYVTYMNVENRVSGNHLSDELPTGGVMKMENGKCIPSSADNVKQRTNYIHLVERIITTNIPCLNFLADLCPMHISHQYSAEMKKRSDSVSYFNTIRGRL
jgi:hypothetical protein